MPSPAYMSIKGKNQGLITQDCSTADSIGVGHQPLHKDEAIIQSFSHVLTLPTDSQSGQPSGMRQHGQFVVHKDIDRSSPLLANALASGEMMENVKIRLYRTSVEGFQENYYTIDLTDAMIVGITSGMPSARSSSGVPFESVSFSYRAIAWTHKNSGTSGSDDWRKPV